MASFPRAYILTPESVKSLNRYLDSRKINGETITEESYVFTTYNMRTKRNDYLSTQDLSSILKRLIRKAGIKREKITSKHYDKAQSYGFRKRFNTILKINNDVNSNITEKLMAHKRGLDGRYLVPTIDECFNEFRKAITELTIDNTERDKLKITKQEEQISSLQITQEEKMKNMEERLNSLSDSQFAMMNTILEIAKTDKRSAEKFAQLYEKSMEQLTDPDNFK